MLHIQKISQYLYYLVKKIDQFGSKIQLNHKKRTSVKTHFGGIMTLLILGLGLYLMIYFGEEIITKTKPFIRFNKVRRNDSTVYMKDFPLYLIITDKLGQNFTDIDKYLTFAVDNMVINSNWKLTYQSNLTMGTCDDSHLGKNKEKMIGKGTLNGSTSLKCLNWNQYTKFENDFSSLSSNYLNLHIKKCNNKTDKKICASKADMDSILSDFYVGFHFFNYYIDMSIPTPPISYHDINAQQVGLNVQKKNYFKFITTEVVNDDGWFGEEPVKTTLKQLDDVSMDIGIDEKSDEIYMITLSSPRIGENHHRSYVKIQIIVGSLGGIFNVVMIIGSITCNYISESSFLLQQAKELIHLSGYDSEVLENNIISDLTVIPFNINNNNGDNERPRNSNLMEQPIGELLHMNKNPDTKEERKEKPKETQKSEDMTTTNPYSNMKVPIKDVSFCSYMCHSCSTKRPENEEIKAFYDASFDYFRKQLDINRNIKSRQDLEIMKSILFSKEEYKEIFEYKLQIDEIMKNYDKEQIEEELESQKEQQNIEIVDEKKEMKLQSSVKNKINKIRKSIKPFGMEN
jgi:hypothetical protein